METKGLVSAEGIEVEPKPQQVRFRRSPSEISRLPKTSPDGSTLSSITKRTKTLASVCEVSGATLLGPSGTPASCSQDIAKTGFLSSYIYNALDNLQAVTQGGESRTFLYDGTSRLTSSNNPESGTVTYTYDSDANCNSHPAFSGELISKVDGRGIRTCFQYDADHRLLTKTYSDGTPSATFFYDESSKYAHSLTNTVGRRSSEATGGSNPTGEIFSYDQLGRVIDNSQCTPQNCSAATAFSITYPSHDYMGMSFLPQMALASAMGILTTQPGS